MLCFSVRRTHPVLTQGGFVHLSPFYAQTAYKLSVNQPTGLHVSKMSGKVETAAVTFIRKPHTKPVDKHDEFSEH